MNKVIEVYETHEGASAAIKILRNAGFPLNSLSIRHRENLGASRINVKLVHPFEISEISICIALASLVGLMSGLGVFMIPGLHFLYNSGPMKGLLVGVFFGILISVIFVVLPFLIIDLVKIVRHETKLNKGKYLVFYDGHRKADIRKAHEILNTPDLPLELEVPGLPNSF